MKDFHYYLPVNLIFGAGKAEETGREAAKYGTKAMIVTGRGSTKRTGLLDRTRRLLEAEGMDVTVFDKAEPNPLASTVMRGAGIAREHGCQLIVGLGGGSILDCSKAIAFAACNEGDIFDYIYGVRKGERALPLILVPTTCGTGSEGNCFAVLTDDETKDKKSLRDPLVIAKASIVDPQLMTTMPAGILASVGFDALCHCMEGYLSKNCDPLTELLALEGIRLLGKNLPKIYQEKAKGIEAWDDMDQEAWSAVTLASTYGGMVIHHAGVAAPHGLEHPASGLRNITHGRGLAALTPVICRRSIPSAPDKYAEISRLLGGKDDTDCVMILEQLLKTLDLQTTLSKEGVSAEDVDWMTQNAFKVSAASIQNHPKVFSEEEVKEIYLEAL
nr:iron-containing alcohol dehydrogenase [uncultured Merdimonas sp.]